MEKVEDAVASLQGNGVLSSTAQTVVIVVHLMIVAVLIGSVLL